MFFGTGCEILAIEPNFHAFQKLSELSTSYKRIKPLKAAACCFNGETNLFLHQNEKENQIYYSTGSSLLSNKTNVDSNNFEKVCALDLSEFIKKQRRPIRLLKIDIEGYEVDLIPHLIKNSALDHVSFLLVETHEKKNPFLQEKTALMKKMTHEIGFERVCWDWH